MCAAKTMVLAGTYITNYGCTMINKVPINSLEYEIIYTDGS
jgi:hypothetical protein